MRVQLSETERSVRVEAECFIATAAPEDVLIRFPWYGPEGSSAFVLDAARRTLVVRAEHRVEVERSLSRCAGRIQARLDQRLLILKYLKARLKVRSLLLKVCRHVVGERL